MTYRKNNFAKAVLKVTSQIPQGKVMTYAEVAKAAGSPRAYRAVGNILHRAYRERMSQLPKIASEPIPCHRVIRTDGKIGNYALGALKKEQILMREGLKIEKHKIDMG